MDHEGEIDAFRRYKEFNLLREYLSSRFYGLYVPPIPPKKKIVRKSFIFIKIY